MWIPLSCLPSTITSAKCWIVIPHNDDGMSGVEGPLWSREFQMFYEEGSESSPESTWALRIYTHTWKRCKGDNKFQIHRWDLVLFIHFETSFTLPNLLQSSLEKLAREKKKKEIQTFFLILFLPHSLPSKDTNSPYRARSHAHHVTWSSHKVGTIWPHLIDEDMEMCF